MLMLLMIGENLGTNTTQILVPHQQNILSTVERMTPVLAQKDWRRISQ
jgi:hypothetical protein